MYYLGIDVGGTNIKAGVVNHDGYVLAETHLPTDAAAGPQQGVQTIKKLAEIALEQAALEMQQIMGVGLATPGTMDIPSGMLLDPPNLPGWENFPIRQQVEETLNKQTILQNDANAAAYAEFWIGAGQHVNSLVMFTLGTGIGGGIIINDMIVEGAHSHGSECGHIIIEYQNGRYCDTGQYGTLEAYAGAKALVRRCNEALDAGENSVLQDLYKSNKEITPLEIATAAMDGDSLADRLIMEMAVYLGIGATTIMHVIDPDMILYGGGMTFGREETGLGVRFLERIRQEVEQRAFPACSQNTTIEYASLGGAAGFIGAAGCARQGFGGGHQ